MGAQTYELALLLSARDAASGTLDRYADKLRATGKEGRAALKDLTDLRREMARGITVAGIGVAGLAMLNNGVKAAGNFQAATTDLRTAITELNADGSKNIGQLNRQMREFESLGMELGNSLPGSTQDFIEMFAALKQGGLDTDTILQGAGRSAAYLAVVSKQLPKDLAVPLAAYGQQFGLKGQDYAKLADLFARSRASTGAMPDELVEASKYFQLRAGASLGMSGFESAQTTTQLLSLLGRKGLRGSEAGTGLSSVFSRITFESNEQQEVLKGLRKQGINLEFFDKQGRFKGIENAVAQLEKMRNLSTEMRTSATKKLFNEEGMGAANILIESGVAGFRQSNAELQRKLSLQQQVNEATAGYNAKVEALKGTLDNLKVTAFEPMLQPASALADKTNSAVGALQGFAKENPTLTKTAAYLFAVSSAALAVSGGFKAMKAGWQLWRIATGAGVAEDGFLAMLRRTRTEAAGATTALGKVGTAARGLKGALAAVPTGLKIAVLAVGIEYTLSKIYELKEASDELNNARKGMTNSAADTAREMQRSQQLYAQRGQAYPQEKFRERAQLMMRSAQGGERDLEFAAVPSRFSWWERFLQSGKNPYQRPFDAKTPDQVRNYAEYQRREPANVLRERAPDLAVPQVMGEFRKLIEQWNLPRESQDRLTNTLREAFPESFQKSTQMAAEEMSRLNGQTTPLIQSFTSLLQPTNSLPPALGSAADAALSFSNRINSIQIVIPPPVQSAAPAEGQQPQIRPSGLRGDARTPMVQARVPTVAALRGGRGDTHIRRLNVNIPAGSPAAADPEAFFGYLNNKLERMQERA